MTPGALLAVAAGGALGAVMRYVLVLATARPAGGFPFGHFAANVIGSLAIGALYVVLATRVDAATLRLFLVTGVLGAFTTYSAFSLDALTLAERGQWPLATLYVIATVAACLGGCAIGMLVGRAAIS